MENIYRDAKSIKTDDPFIISPFLFSLQIRTGNVTNPLRKTEANISIASGNVHKKR